MTARAPSAAGLGEYPRRYDVRALPERRQRAAFRFLSWMCVMTGLMNIGVAGAAMALIPIKSSEPVLAVHRADGISGAAAPNAWLSGGAAYVERMAVEYAKARHLVSRDQREMQRIWADDGFLAGVEELGSLGQFTARNKERMDAFASVIRAGDAVETRYVGSLELVVGEVYQVDFDVVRINPRNEAARVERLRAVVETAFDPAAGGTTLNPLGFQVLAYSEEPRRE